jgi:hypothetical protein
VCVVLYRHSHDFASERTLSTTARLTNGAGAAVKRGEDRTRERRGRKRGGGGAQGGERCCCCDEREEEWGEERRHEEERGVRGMADTYERPRSTCVSGKSCRGRDKQRAAVSSMCTDSSRSRCAFTAARSLCVISLRSHRRGRTLGTTLRRRSGRTVLALQ